MRSSAAVGGPGHHLPPDATQARKGEAAEIIRVNRGDTSSDARRPAGTAEVGRLPSLKHPPALPPDFRPVLTPVGLVVGRQSHRDVTMWEQQLSRVDEMAKPSNRLGQVVIDEHRLVTGIVEMAETLVHGAVDNRQRHDACVHPIVHEDAESRVTVTDGQQKLVPSRRASGNRRKPQSGFFPPPHERRALHGLDRGSIGADDDVDALAFGHGPICRPESSDASTLSRYSIRSGRDARSSRSRIARWAASTRPRDGWKSAGEARGALGHGVSVARRRRARKAFARANTDRTDRVVEH